jgi:signal transduction histidine kinase/ligand-binding sensor domain-containing protein/DNA-binding response OmpR family regulator
MWFGTGDGLIKFDGINLYTYENDPNSSLSLSSNSVNAIAEDHNNNLWIATSDGLNLYNREKDNFKNIRDFVYDNNALNFNYVNSIYCQYDSLLWLGTFTGIYIYNTINHQVRNYSYSPDNPNSISMNHITCIKADIEGNIWAGTQEGLNQFISEKEGFRRFLNEPGNNLSLSNDVISSITVDPEGNLWVGTSGGGVNKIIKKGNEFFFERYTSGVGPKSLSNNYILSLSADKNGFLWIGTDNGGLNRLSINNGNIDIYRMTEGEEYSLKSNSIWSLYCDNEDRIWIGSYNKGISVIDERFGKFNSFKKNIYDKNSLPDNDVTGFAEDSKGNIWIATDGGGICKFNPITRKIENTITSSAGDNRIINNALQNIFIDHEDNIWICAWGGGIDKLNKKGIRIRNYKLDRYQGSGNNNPIGIFTDSKSNMWVGTSGSGLFRYNKQKDRFDPVVSINESQILSRNSYITCLLEDSQGTIWVTSVYGLGIIKAKDDLSFECTDLFHTEDTNSISSNTLLSIFEDSRKRMWFGTSDKGLNLYDRNTKSFTHISKSNGLASNTIQGILEDDEGQLWISTNRGISRLNYESMTVMNFSQEDGLCSNEFYSRSCLRARNGELYFGNENGFNLFSPGKIKSNPIIPEVYLTDFKINNRSININDKRSPLKKHISVTDEIRLTYKQSSFTIDFVALNYTHSSRNRFCYKLVGFDEDWICIGTSRSAYYTNIKPGSYVFLVKGSNNDGVWNEKPAKLKIIIEPPYWKTWWAKLIYLLTFFVTVLLLIVIRNERADIKARLKVEQMAREKEHELNESNIRFFTNISHEFRTPLSLILAPLESLLGTAKLKTKEQLLVIYRNANKLLRLTNNLLDFRKLQVGITRLQVKQFDIVSFIHEISSYFAENMKSRSIEFKIESDKSISLVWLDPEKLETIILNLLSNAYKFTPDHGSIRVYLSTKTGLDLSNDWSYISANIKDDQNFIEVSITDNGIGIQSEELPMIFDMFYRSDSTMIKRYSGTGIGLALVKGLTELHHGFIKAESIPGQKTSLVFILPVDRNVYKENEIQIEADNQISKEGSGYYEYFSPPNIKVPEEKYPDKDKPEILIVEDNDELRSFLVRELEKNFNISHADNGLDGIDRAISDIPDLIVSDILMPKASGIELCKAVKSDLRSCHIPVILLTAKTTVPDQIEGIETGADAYITKPFNIQFLNTMIMQLIESRRKLYAHFSQDVYIMPGKLTSNKMDQEFLQKTIDYIMHNIAENKLSVEGLAVTLSLSRSNVYRKIKALTGQTIVEFIRTIRLKHALKLMETKKYTIAEIAYQTGFSSPSYFTRSFKENYGKTPSEYLES